MKPIHIVKLPFDTWGHIPSDGLLDALRLWQVRNQIRDTSIRYYETNNLS